MHTGNGCCSSSYNALCSHSGIGGLRKNIKGYGLEKVDGFPDRIRLANYADVGVFPHQRFHGKSGSSGLSEHIIDICRKCTMHGIWKNDLMNSEESTKPFS